MNFRSNLSEICPYKPGLSEKQIKEKHKIKQVIKLASNENPYGKSKKAEEAVRNYKTDSRYPDNYCTSLRKAISNKYNIAKDNIIFGNGSVEIIQMLSRALLDKNDEIITCSPTFQSYLLEAVIQDSIITEIPLKRYTFDLDEIINKISSKTKAIYISNPNNPTGTIIENDELVKFIDNVPKNIVVVLDEAYAEFVNNKNYPNSIELLKKYTNLCILRTFSKAYGLADLRIGYGIASNAIIQELEKVRLPFNVSRIAEEAAVASLDDESFIQYCATENRRVIEYTYKKLKEYNIDYIETEANFIMIDTKIDGNIVGERLQKRGFIVRTNFKNLETFIRVTIGTQKDMEQFVKCLNDILNEIKVKN